MAQRKRIALIFSVNPNWMGGTYYVLNIINALDSLPDEEKPEILLCSSMADFQFALRNVSYPYLKRIDVKYPFFLIKRIINKISRILLNRNLLPVIPLLKENVDMVFPLMKAGQVKSKSKKIYWIPDFQEKFLPQFFNEQELKVRDDRIKGIITENAPVVFSSLDAFKAFKKFYPQGVNGKEKIYRFAVQIPATDNLDSKKILKELNIKKPFFYCGNQLWQHKNHKVLFEAVKILKDKGIDISLVCSGATEDYRNPDYFKNLCSFIESYKLKDNIKILGLIDRKAQLCLMKDCEAIIQPSLFEGWSTSVEEAKALNKFLILSDLEVHKEQASENAVFFDRSSAEDLAEKIEGFLVSRPEISKSDYNLKIQEAARNFLNILDSQN